MKPGNIEKDYQLHWHIKPCDQGFYSLFSHSAGGYLDGRNKDIPECCVTNREPLGDMYLNWEIDETDGFITLKCKSNGHYLDGREVDGEVAYATGRDPKGDNCLQWSLELVTMGIMQVTQMIDSQVHMGFKGVDEVMKMGKFF